MSVGPNWEYKPSGATLRAYIKSDAFVNGIRGPFGSGKSTASIMKLWRNVLRQPQAPDGKRYRRSIIVRNSYPELSTTTIKTWHQWWPAGFGRWRGQGPPTHHIQFEDIDWEVIFLALDRPDDIAKLLSSEPSDAWINEAREVPKAVLDALTGRVGRFPPVRDGGCANPMVCLDTNPPDTDHWWYRMAEEQQPAEFAFFSQPSGRSAEAENLGFLPPRYYQRQMAGKDDAWIKVYVDGDYGYVQDGKSVFPEYKDGMHCRPLEIVPKRGLLVGLDFGLTPAAIIGQRLSSGVIVWRSELVTEDMGARRFGELVGAELRGRYGAHEIEAITGDPAGNQRSGIDEDETVFKILRAVGVDARPANTNDFTMRREAVAAGLSRLVDGTPALVVHPDCKVTRKGLMGGYRYRRLQVAGDERYHDVPEKNAYSHPLDAGQYLMLGAGEGRELVRRSTPMPFRRPKLGFVA